MRQVAARPHLQTLGNFTQRHRRLGVVLGVGPWYRYFSFLCPCRGFVLPSQYNRCARWPLVPICKRSAASLSVIVVFCLSNRASRNFSGSPLRRSARSFSLHPSFFNASLTTCSDCAASDS